MDPIQTSVQISDFQPKPNYLKIIIFSVLIVMTLGLITYLFFQNQKLQKQVLNPPVSPTIQVLPPTPKTVSSILISPDETADWKTYNSNLLGIFIKYPNNWFLESENINDKSFRLQNYDPATAQGRDYIPIEDKGKFSVVFYDWSQKLKAKTIVELKQELNNEKECFYIGDSAGKRISLNEQIQNINSLEIFSRDTRCSEAPISSLQKEYFILDGKDKIIKIFPGLDVESGIQSLDQILSTFKFVDDRSVCVPTYQVETNSVELTAEQNYSVRCTEQRSEKDCFSIDLYNQKAYDFSIPDGIPDCIWKNP